MGRLRINYNYIDRDGKHLYGSLNATVEDALRIFRGFDGISASLYLIVDDDAMIAWLKHGDAMYEVQLLNHRTRRRRFGQVLNQFAEDCIRKVFAGDRTLAALEEHSHLYYGGFWEREKDRNYWLARDVKKWETGD